MGYLLEASAVEGRSRRTHPSKSLLPARISRCFPTQTTSGSGTLEHSDPLKMFLRHRPTLTLVSATAERANYLTEQWHLKTAKVTDAWEITRGSPDITIAIFDDGTEVTHPEFAGKLASQYDFANHTANGTPKASTDNHGTACAGVATAKGIQAYGAAPDCKLMAVRTPDYLGVADEADMFRWAADNGADIISCSWGPEDGTGGQRSACR